MDAKAQAQGQAAPSRRRRSDGGGSTGEGGVDVYNEALVQDLQTQLATYYDDVVETRIKRDLAENEVWAGLLTQTNLH